MDSSKSHSYILSADLAHPRTAGNCWEPLGCSSRGCVVWELRSWKFQLTPDPHIPDLQGSQHSSLTLNGIITTHNDLYMTNTAWARGLGIFSLRLINCHTNEQNVTRRSSFPSFMISLPHQHWGSSSRCLLISLLCWVLVVTTDVDVAASRNDLPLS